MLVETGLWDIGRDMSVDIDRDRSVDIGRDMYVGYW